jgi:hypothetical protein
VQCIDAQGGLYLRLPNNGLAGGLPASLGRLGGLVALDLSHNPLLGGALPSTLGSLRQLGLLYLYSCSFSGPLPPQLGDLSALQNLDLKDNQVL